MKYKKVIIIATLIALILGVFTTAFAAISFPRMGIWRGTDVEDGSNISLYFFPNWRNPDTRIFIYFDNEATLLCPTTHSYGFANANGSIDGNTFVPDEMTWFCPDEDLRFDGAYGYTVTFDPSTEQMTDSDGVVYIKVYSR